MPGASSTVKTAGALALLLCALGRTGAQTNEIDAGDVMDAVQQFAHDNLDDSVAQALQDVDRSKVRDFLNQFQSYLQGDNVFDLGQLQETARTILPLLDAHPETRPYAAWLRSRQDYFDAADTMQSAAPPPKVIPGQPVPLTPNPSFKTEREYWVKVVTPRPAPKPAQDTMPGVKAAFASQGVPSQLAWLAEVESGFDSRAQSPVGALGMFQLMPATARQMGLSLSPRDQRLQPDAEARAAARYLRQLYGQFGDWRLAVAAYNCGGGTLQKALERHHAHTYEAVAGHLPAETQMYVPKVEATILHREGLELDNLPPPARI
jgi:membrane-bound lytic murein transglycosylase D